MISALVLAASAACATVPPSRSPDADPERVVLDLQAKNAGYARRIAELENRIFILEDQLDSRASAGEQRAPAKLPPSPQEPEVTPPILAPASSAAESETTIVAEHPVDYTGDAVQPNAGQARPRPSLRLSANKPGGGSPAAPAPVSNPGKSGKR